MKRLLKVFVFTLALFFICNILLSCAKQEVSQAPIRSESEITDPDEPIIKETLPTIEIPFDFDSTPPKVIDLSVFSSDPAAYGDAILSSELLPLESGIGEYPKSLPIYQIDPIPEYQKLTEEQMQIAKENLERYLSLYDGAGKQEQYVGLDPQMIDGELVTAQTRGRCDATTLDGVGIRSYSNQIILDDIKLSFVGKQEQTIPSKEEILSEIKQNDYLKAACAFLGITDPDISLEASKIESDYRPSVSWSAHIIQTSPGVEATAVARSFQSIRIFGFTLYDSLKEGESPDTFSMVYRVFIPVLSPNVLVENVPIISMEDALKEVLDGRFIITGAMYNGGDDANHTKEDCYAVRMTYRYDVVPNGHVSGIYIPCYEFYFNCVENTTEKPSQTILVLPACNLYLKPAE